MQTRRHSFCVCRPCRPRPPRTSQAANRSALRRRETGDASVPRAGGLETLDRCTRHAARAARAARLGAIARRARALTERESHSRPHTHNHIGSVPPTTCNADTCTRFRRTQANEDCWLSQRYRWLIIGSCPAGRPPADSMGPLRGPTVGIPTAPTGAYTEDRIVRLISVDAVHPPRVWPRASLSHVPR